MYELLSFTCPIFINDTLALFFLRSFAILKVHFVKMLPLYFVKYFLNKYTLKQIFFIEQNVSVSGDALCSGLTFTFYLIKYSFLEMEF